MSSRPWILSLFYMVTSISLSHSADPSVNVALGKPVTAIVTCGINGPEKFTSQRFAGISQSSNSEVCNSTSQYPPQNIVDASLDTWWQSTSRINFIANGYGVNGRPDAEIFIDLQQNFSMEYIEIHFGESQRPGRMIFYKSTSTDPTPNIVWFYVVTSMIDCVTKYNVTVNQLPIALDSRPCFNYPSTVSLNEIDVFDFTQTRQDLKEWNAARSVRIEFYDIYLSMGVTPNANEYQHYTVRTVIINAKCRCNNQQLDCVVDNSTMKYACLCGNFTTGQFCEQCLPLYNNRTYISGRTCQACDCSGKSNSCRFDTVQNIAICDSCQNSTTGPKCDRCLDNLFRPSGVPATDSNPCIPCNCSIITSIYMAGGCLPTADPNYPGMNPGDCYCKPNIMGPTCDRCRDGFYSLSNTGCQNCSCITTGTLSGSQSCNSTTGQCQCKRFVTGLRCDVCMDGYYNLDPNNPDGCTSCGCNPGGSVLGTNCGKTNGQCTCRRNIIGPTCDRPASGYYLPDFYFLSSEMENLDNPWDSSSFPGFYGFGYVKTVAQVPVSTTINLTPLGTSGMENFRILLRYIYPSTGSITGRMSISGGNIVTSSNDFSLPSCQTWCMGSTGDVKLSRIAQSTVTYTFPGEVYLDRVIAVPLEYFNTTALLGPDNANFLATCSLLGTDLYTNGVLKADCEKYAFIISAWYLDGALPCSCNPLGANDSFNCQPTGGQCTCKPGVMGRRCGRCMIRYYNLNENGCTACTCTQTTYNMCNDVTGACLCPPGTEGANCTTCKLNYYNWDAVKGCQPCGCSSPGSLSLTCDVGTGRCTCKPGVTGLKCELCQDGYKEMNILGCSPCSCDPNGSVSGTNCDKVTSNCVCKANVGGSLCDSCKLNSFTLSTAFVDGCLACICMGITTTCSQSNYLPVTFNLNPLPMTFVVVNDDGSLSSAATPNRQPNSSLVVINVPANSNLYWSDPQLKGNMLSFYGATISFRAKWSSADTSPSSSTQNIVFISRNGTKFNFKLIDYIPLSAGVETQLKTMISLENTPDYATSGLTRAQILMGLTDITAVMFPATYKSLIHDSSIGDVRYALNPSYVEGCLCPPGYSGSSCEACSAGYMRSNIVDQGYLGLCKACECNGKSTSCDLLTGYCTNCQQFTTGASCETCIPGYYRDPTGSCLKCPCEGNRVQSTNCSMINTTVVCSSCSVGHVGNDCRSCSPGYYGNIVAMLDICKPCQCNGFASLCDSLGTCINCTNSTMGVNCERCIPGMYQDPATKLCIACNCNVTGTVSSSTNATIECDLLTGQCPCKSGISSQRCDSCTNSFFNYTSAGCMPCLCNEFGSQNLSCSDTGVCTCKANTTGVKCDQCETGNFGIANARECQDCTCYPLGSRTDNSTTANYYECNKTTGQCNCRDFVVGRNCTKCQFMYFNTTEMLNCTACTGCEASLGQYTSNIRNTSSGLSLPQITNLATIQQIYADFTKYETQAMQLCKMLNGCVSSNLYSNFTNQIDVANKSLDTRIETLLNLYNSFVNLSRDLGTLNNRSNNALLRIQNMKKDVDNLAAEFGNQISTSQNNLRTLQNRNDTADKLWRNSPYNGSSQSLVPISWNYGGLFDNENATLYGIYAKALSTIQMANQLISDLNRLTTNSIQMIANLDALQQSYAATSSQIATITAGLNNYAGLVNVRLSEINEAVAKRSTFNLAYDSIMNRIRNMETTLTATDLNIATCQQRLWNMINMIYGNTTIRPQVLIDSGFQGWNQAYDLVNQLLQTSLVTLNTSLQNLASAEQKAAALSTQANNILTSFQAVQSRGQTAVDVINRFQSVINNLMDSVNQARNLDVTLQTILRSFSSVSINDLQLRANQLFANVNATKQSIDNFLATTSITGLNSLIDSANASILASVALWADLNQRLQSFNQNSTTFLNLISRTVQENNQNLTAGNQFADTIATRITSLKQQNDNLQLSLDNAATSVGNVANTIANSLNIQSQLINNLTTFQNALDAANATSMNNLNISQNSISASKTALQDQFSRVDDLIKQAQTKLAELEQPVYFTGNTYEQVSNPDVNVNQLYNSIQLDFSYNSLPRGVLLFVENTNTQEKLLLQLINNTVCFEFSFADVKTMLCNVAQLSAGSWFRVYWTRYETDAKLTVTLLSTGGTLAASARAASTNSVRITLNSPIYVGGLLLNAANILKVYNSGTGFNGCIYNVMYNGASLPLWQSILRSTSTATCCKKPIISQRQTYITGCVTLYGFGYILFNPRDTFSVTGAQPQVSLQFRTYVQQGVVLLVPSPTNTDYYGIFIQNGRVSFSISSGGVVTSVVTDNAYNTGRWFKLTTSHTSLSMSLIVAPVNATTQSETKTSPAVINLSSLSGVSFLIGGQNPSFIRGTITYGFAGAIKDFQHTTSFSSILLPDSLNTGINSSLNVDLTRCLENVQDGLGFSNRSSYTCMRPLVAPIASIKFTFLTTAPSGILFYANLEKSSTDQNTFFYAALYNGDIFIIFNQGLGVQPAFRSRDMYLSNGLEHTVNLIFTLTNSPRMTVDNLETHTGAITMIAYLRLVDCLYMGGVPASMSLDASVLPVKISFIGGLRQISLNDVPVQIYDPNVLSGSTSRGIYLSGVPLPQPPASPPCNPCPTTLPPMACVINVPNNTFYGNNTFGFVLETENYIQYNIAGDENLFLSGFQCSLSFKTLVPDGLLIYVSNSVLPLRYFAIYLFKGILNAIVNNGTSQLSVASKKTYYDGLWHKVSVYMSPSSLAILIQDSQDFNNALYNGSINLIVSSPLYIGGVPYAQTPYPDAILSGKSSFKGCLQDLTIQSSSMRTLTTNASKIIASKGISPCSTDTKMGMNIASSGYIRASDSYNANPTFNLVPPFSFFLSFKTSLTSGVLMVAWDSPSKFVAMSIVGGQIQVILSSTSQPFIFTSRAFTTATVCNNAFHNVTMTINLASVTLNIDGNYSETKNFDNFQYAAPLSVPIYVGGVKDPSWNIPGTFSAGGFVGCLQSCFVNGNQVYITQSADVNGALIGCT